MTATMETLLHDSLVLPPDQRVSLARQILASVESAGETNIEGAWATEIEHRLARYQAGATKGIPAAEVFARLRRIAPGA